MSAALQSEKLTERHMLDLLARRYTRVQRGAHRYAFAEHVPSIPWGAARVADFIALDCQRGSWQPWRLPVGDHRLDWGYAVHGHEVKVSRSDWLAELRNPDKAEAFRPYVNYWWLVVADASIVKAGELPDGWGLLVRRGGRLRAELPAPLAVATPMPREMTVALMRAIAKTARNASTIGDLSPSGVDEGVDLDLPVLGVSSDDHR